MGCVICSKCDRPIQRGQTSTGWWEERDGKQYYKVAHATCLKAAFFKNAGRVITRLAQREADK